MRRVLVAVVLVTSMPFATAALAQPGEPPAGFELVFDSRVDEAELLFSDPAAWQRNGSASEGGLTLELASQSAYQPPHRSPVNIALLAPWLFDRFVLEVEVQQTGREYGHRDACFFFAFESAERFYYAHLATAPDDRAHNVFLVDGADRAKTAPVNEAGVDWGQEEWHTVRIERGVSAPERTEVYFDGATTPTVSSSDLTIRWGRLGVGSFDDTARFRALRVWAPETRPAEGNPFD